MPQLPDEYIARMTKWLGEEAPAFFSSYDKAKTHSLRINTLKLDAADPLFQRLAEQFALKPVPWCASGFYYREESRPGKHPYHDAGLYYTQEASAMSAAEMLDPQPGETVLDLAAAPGGKTTHIAAKMKGNGLLIANEIHPLRAKILSQNVERMGIVNAVVTGCSPDRLARRFPRYFDRIMLDAPCSGEGMFRKDPDAVKEWSLQQVAVCAARQIHILEDAARMLKPGGTLAYSTCTFSREENEAVTEAFVRHHREFSILRMERIWPHLHPGEGHFVALLSKRNEDSADAASPKKGSALAWQQPSQSLPRGKSAPRAAQEAMNAFSAFIREHSLALDLPPGEPLLYGEQLYWLPNGGTTAFRAEQLDGLKALRPGLHLAAVKKNRVEPAHALALSLHPKQCADIVSYGADSPEIAAYLKGEPIRAEHAAKGWVLIGADGYPLGWAKASEGLLKNHYPKGLRRN